MFVRDNMIIFDITATEEVKIPHMNLSQLKKIVFQKLKPHKACDVFMLTVEHLRNGIAQMFHCQHCAAMLEMRLF
jgi:hypothetical protein